MLGEILGIGASLLGSLFGSDDKETTSHVDYKRMVKDAEAAGFNPLTAIRNGGSAGFTSTTMPGLSSGEFLADALKGVGQLVSNYDPMAKATADLEYKIKQETLRNLQVDTAARLKASIGGVPASQGHNRVVSPGGMTHALPASAGLPQTPTVEQPTITNPLPTSWGVAVNPDLMDANAWEQRYGEPGDWIGGVLTMAGDGLSAIRRGQLSLMREADKRIKRASETAKKYKAPPDPYYNKMYIPPATYGGPSYR